MTYLDFLHARIIHDGTSNKKVSGKVIKSPFRCILNSTRKLFVILTSKKLKNLLRFPTKK